MVYTNISVYISVHSSKYWNKISGLLNQLFILHKELDHFQEKKMQLLSANLLAYLNEEKVTYSRIQSGNIYMCMYVYKD